MNKLETTVNNELQNVSDWLIANKLTLNLTKSTFLFILPSPKKLNRNVELKLNNEKLKKVKEAKYLGVLIDSKLKWKSHIQNVNMKVAEGIGILSKVRHFAPQRVLLNMYNAFVLPNILYGLLNWGNASKTALDPLNKKFKKAVRLITF